MDKTVQTNSFWESVVGHTGQKDNLWRVKQTGSIPHALLFSGPEGVGKRHLALSFASLLLQGSDPNQSWFEKSTQLLKVGNHPDLQVIFRAEDKRDIAVEDIRTLRDTFHLKPYSSPARVVIIDNAHEMNLSASNSLLTTLEEPNPNSYLFLISHAPQRLPATILSRCQTLPFGLLPQGQIEQLVTALLSGENKMADSTMVKNLCAMCSGSLAPLQLDSFIDPKTSAKRSPDEMLKHLHELLSECTRIRDIIRRALNTRGNPQQAVVVATELTNKELDQQLVWYLLRLEVRQKLRAASSGDTRYWANIMLQSLEAEKLCLERNANMQLQLSSLLLHQETPFATA